MKERRIRLSHSADRDLSDLYDYLAQVSSPHRASIYLDRLTDFMGRLSVFSERGTRREHISLKLHTIGFEKRVSIAFIVEEEEVVILRVLYGGRTADLSKL